MGARPRRAGRGQSHNAEISAAASVVLDPAAHPGWPARSRTTAAMAPRSVLAASTRDNSDPRRRRTALSVTASTIAFWNVAAWMLIASRASPLTGGPDRTTARSTFV